MLTCLVGSNGLGPALQPPVAGSLFLGKLLELCDLRFLNCKRGLSTIFGGCCEDLITQRVWASCQLGVNVQPPGYSC